MPVGGGKKKKWWEEDDEELPASRRPPVIVSSCLQSQSSISPVPSSAGGSPLSRRSSGAIGGTTKKKWWDEEPDDEELDEDATLPEPAEITVSRLQMAESGPEEARAGQQMEEDLEEERDGGDTKDLNVPETMRQNAAQQVQGAMRGHEARAEVRVMAGAEGTVAAQQVQGAMRGHETRAEMMAQYMKNPRIQVRASEAIDMQEPRGEEAPKARVLDGPWINVASSSELRQQLAVRGLSTDGPVGELREALWEQMGLELWRRGMRRVGSGPAMPGQGALLEREGQKASEEREVSAGSQSGWQEGSSHRRAMHVAEGKAVDVPDAPDGPTAEERATAREEPARKLREIHGDPEEPQERSAGGASTEPSPESRRSRRDVIDNGALVRRGPMPLSDPSTCTVAKKATPSAHSNAVKGYRGLAAEASRTATAPAEMSQKTVKQKELEALLRRARESSQSVSRQPDSDGDSD